MFWLGTFCFVLYLEIIHQLVISFLVHHLVVLFQATLVQVGLVAGRDDAGKHVALSLVCVDLHVLLQVGSRGKLFVANVTRERAFSRVQPLVPD